jgi:NADPH2:quinone reductase
MNVGSMRALQIDAYGGPEVMILRELPVPAPGPDDVLVRIAWSGINFMDVYTRLGRYAGAGAKSGHYHSGLPVTLGIEGAGRVAAVGTNVRGWREGDRVAYALARGSYADYAVVPAWQLARVPDELGLEIAAASIFQGLTAHYLVADTARLTPGMTCLVHSASGGIGQLLIQLARNAGARVVASASSPPKCAIAQARGADAIAGPAADDFVAACRSLTDGAGVDVVFDSVGAAAYEGNLRALRRRGLLVHYGANSGPIGPIDAMRLADSGSLFFTRPRLADHVADAASVSSRANAIFAGLVDGSLKVDVSGRHTFEEVATAHRALTDRTAIGKSVLAVDPSFD